MNDDIFLILKVFVNQDVKVNNNTLFNAIYEFLKNESINVNVYIQKINTLIDENFSIISDTIEVLNYSQRLLITIIGCNEDVYKILNWLKSNLIDATFILEKNDVEFTNKFKKIIFKLNVTAKNLMQKDIIFVYDKTPIVEIIKTIFKNGIRFLPVLSSQNQSVIGVITEGDLIKNSLIPLKTKLYNSYNLDLKTFQNIINELSNYNHMTAYDIMESCLVSIKPDTKLKDILTKANYNKLKRLLVVDDNNKLLGIVTRLDIFKFLLSYLNNNANNFCDIKDNKISQNSKITDNLLSDFNVINNGIKKFIDYQYTPINKDEKLINIISKLTPHEYTFLPVVDLSNNLIGIVTDEQICKLKITDKHLNFFEKIYNFLFSKPTNISLDIQKFENLKISDLIKTDNQGYIINENSDICEVLNKMIINNIKMLVVIDDNNKYKGIISRRNIMRYLIS